MTPVVSNKHLSLLFLLVTSLLCITWPLHQAWAKKRVVIMGFSGVRGNETARLISRAMSRSHQLVSYGQLIAEARARGEDLGTAQGRSLAARGLGVAAMISGSISKLGLRWMLRTRVYSGQHGQSVGSSSFPMRGTRLDPTTLRHVTSALNKAVARARPGPALARSSRGGSSATRASPRRSTPRRRGRGRKPVVVYEVPVTKDQPRRTRQRPAETTDPGVEPDSDDPKGLAGSAAVDEPQQGDSLGFEIRDDEQPEGLTPTYEEESSAEKKKEKKPPKETTVKSKSSSTLAPWENVIRAYVGVAFVKRSFNVNDPLTDEADKFYASPMVPSWLIDLEGYPLALLGGGLMANIGLQVSYYRAFVLQSNVDGYEDPISTTLHQLQLSLIYRWNLLSREMSPIVKLGLGWGRLGFVIHWPDETALLPNVVYSYLDLPLIGEIPFYHNAPFAVGGLLSFHFLYVFSAGDIEREDSGGYGQSTTTGIDIGGGLYGSWSSFSLRLNGFYRRMGFSFARTCENTGCKIAGGALDVYMGILFSLGYAY